MTSQQWRDGIKNGTITLPAEDNTKAWYYDIPGRMTENGRGPAERRAKCKLCYKDMGATGISNHHNSAGCQYIANFPLENRAYGPPTPFELAGGSGQYWSRDLEDVNIT